ncbi:phosphotransferase system, enzyme I, PtsI [Amycolatopsis xylanica]|uniref:Phosphoenolpyruvate-protein phosphotransferase n=1 Tax=Amycolatopsis xylanica TaxID=589385 RepID=A0A1H3GYS9_9PSEU|nr:phosphoenolpyruvate--protein phosphotransferase [Amycolatopsis xylanica]SDY08105.1 phosphotransferase system, enzyme I, PtsI [Amycolatopsis xylanica]
MDELTGSPASPGTVSGPVARMSAPPSLPERWDGVDDAPTELARAVAALIAVSEDLKRRAAPLTGEARDILEVQSAMAADPAIEDGVRAAVEAGSPAAWALRDSFDAQIEKLAAIGGYLAERTTDLADLRDRAIASVLGLAPPGLPVSDKPYVLVSADLAPADTVTLDASLVLAIVTEKGGPTSHTAIVARALGIPAVVACAAAAGLADGDVVLVDGAAGTVVRDPDPAVVAEVERQAALAHEELARHSGPGSTKDGHPVKLLLNVGGAAVPSADAEGVGLFRTEFLFLDRTEAPSVDEQRSAYGKVFAEFGGRPVVIRTLDAGADKPVPFANDDSEPNPALGVRGYRIGARKPALLEAQLEAIALAARDHDAQVQVMAPMIATPAEAAEFARVARAQGISRVGVMIEIPAAAILAGAILAEVDFVSIGTNDLSQYTFAADRMLGELGPLLDPWQPALLHLVSGIAAAGTRAGKPVGICGEAASDPGLAPIFAGMGVTSLSMSAPAVPAVRAALRGHTLAECQALAAEALQRS